MCQLCVRRTLWDGEIAWPHEWIADRVQLVVDYLPPAAKIKDDEKQPPAKRRARRRGLPVEEVPNAGSEAAGSTT